MHDPQDPQGSRPFRMFLAILSVIVVAGALCAAALYAVTVFVGAIAWRLLVLLAATAMS